VRTDIRGNRRTFSIATAPGEDEIHIATKFSAKSSSYKQTLLDLSPGDLIMAGQLAGDFVMPQDPSKKLVFIAGGIGITPFVSMVRTIIKTKQKRDIVLLYLISAPGEYCYQRLWQVATRFGIRVIPIVSDKNDKSWKGRSGYLTEAILKAETPDYEKRRYYISGPPGLVENYTKLLRSFGISYNQIVTDHFSGY
jgi:ferredoxin-NADP reductase